MPPQPTDPVLPWDWAWPLEAVMWLVIIIIAGTVIYAARQGRDRRGLPDQLGRDVEDFAGVAQEANGPLTTYLIVFYAVVALGMASYLIVTLASGYRY